MIFSTAKEADYPHILEMLERAKKELLSEGILQWNDQYPSREMILHDIRGGYTKLVSLEGESNVAFFTSNSICEDDVHDNIKWLYSGNNWIILHRLCVDPKHQNHGIGQAIIAKFEEEARKKAFKSSRIDVFSTNEKAIYIYEKFGYTRVGEAMCERGSFYIYEKMLNFD